MTDKENVLHGLSSCGTDLGIPNICEVTECPYREDKAGCVHKLAHDAEMLIAELLKAQEPRLVTEADFENADEYGYLPAWCEMKNDLFCECILIGALEKEGCRYWTVKPTDEQRKATQWN